MPLPWFEHGLSRPQRDVLTNYTTVASEILFDTVLYKQHTFQNTK